MNKNYVLHITDLHIDDPVSGYELLRKGKIKWRYRGGAAKSALDYFLASENLWIRTLAEYVNHQIGSSDLAHKRI